MNIDDIRTQYHSLRLTPGVRQVDIVQRMGITEGQLLAAFVGQSGALQVQALSLDFIAILRAIESLGEVMALTRNPQAVHEKYLRYTAMQQRDRYLELMTETAKISFDLDRIKQAFYVIDDTPRGIKHSIQWFDDAGVAVHKIFAIPTTDHQALTALVKQYHSNHMLDFTQATSPSLDLPSDLNTPQVTAMTYALETIATQCMPVVITVGNHVTQQQHYGLVSTITTMGPWLNVLDPLFNLHLRIDQITRVVFDLEQIFLYAYDECVLTIACAALTPSKQEQWASLVQDCHDVMIGAI